MIHFTLYSTEKCSFNYDTFYTVFDSIQNTPFSLSFGAEKYLNTTKNGAHFALSKNTNSTYSINSAVNTAG